MRAGTATQHERLLRLHRRNVDLSTDAGLTGVRFSDVGDGSTLALDGRQVANFGNCSYLGLAVDPRLKEAAISAIERFGPLYSSSQMYSAIDLYSELEELMKEMTDAPAVVLPPTTTLGHLATLPTLVGPTDGVVLDSHSHASLQMTVQVLAARGVDIHPVPHNDRASLEETIGQASEQYRRVWYVCDGVYSMFGDLAPLGFISALADRFPNLYTYYDDAHGFSWLGKHGRGYVLDAIPLSERTVVAVGLAKSFGSGGAVLFFGDPDLATTVRRLGGPMTFSGPIHPPSLGAAVASAHIHLSDEHLELRRRILDQIGLVASLLAHHQLPSMSWSETPIWFIRTGDPDKVVDLGGRLLDDGFYVNVSAFPAVPMGLGGIRFTHTLNNTDVQIEALVERIAHHYRQVVGEPDAVIDLTELERVEQPLS